MSDTNPNDSTVKRTARKRWLTILAVGVGVAALVWLVYYVLYARYFESTDDAYVGGNIVAVTARDSATVLAIYADNTEAVKRGQLLVAFDPSTAQVAMQSAEADLARTVRAVRGQFAKAAALDATVHAAQVALAQAESDYRRRAASVQDGAVSAEEVAHAKDAVTSARAALVSAENDRAQAEATVAGTTVTNNPDVLAAIARLRDAAITQSHMKLIAPVSGVVAQRTVQVGQQVAAGTPLMAVVPLNDVWVDANFKEGQLARMRAGQPATVTADIYGGGVTYHGKVLGLGAGSGSAFALLPPQNASGNWIKVVQRVPVRIALDPRELAKHPLRVGLSVTVKVDVRNTAGSTLSAAPARPLRGDVGEPSERAVNRLVAKILAANGAEAQTP